MLTNPLWYILTLGRGVGALRLPRGLWFVSYDELCVAVTLDLARWLCLLPVCLRTDKPLPVWALKFAV